MCFFLWKFGINFIENKRKQRVPVQQLKKTCNIPTKTVKKIKDASGERRNKFSIAWGGGGRSIKTQNSVPLSTPIQNTSIKISGFSLQEQKRLIVLQPCGVRVDISPSNAAITTLGTSSTQNLSLGILK